MPAPPPIRLIVRLTPRGGRNAIDGWGRDADGRLHLKVRVAAAPVDGAANAALAALIAKTLGLPKRAVRLLSGEQARLKTLELEGVDEATLHRTLGRPP